MIMTTRKSAGSWMNLLSQVPSWGYPLGLSADEYNSSSDGCKKLRATRSLVYVHCMVVCACKCVCVRVLVLTEWATFYNSRHYGVTGAGERVGQQEGQSERADTASSTEAFAFWQFFIMASDYLSWGSQRALWGNGYLIALSSFMALLSWAPGAWSGGRIGGATVSETNVVAAPQLFDKSNQKGIELEVLWTWDVLLPPKKKRSLFLKKSQNGLSILAY